MSRNSIGQFIAALRKANGMTQQDVADRLNVSNKAVSRWERDECAPDISLIPSIAEMFGVTCDELLKGQRIFVSDSPNENRQEGTQEETREKKEPKVQKQLKSLVNRTLSSFKTLNYISLAVSLVGLICMFGISYGFFRPILGFAVMLLLEVGALFLGIVALNRAKTAKADNELFEEAENSLIAKFDNTLASFSFAAFFAVLSAVLLSLPLIMFLSDYVNSVITFKSYVTQCLGVIALILTVIFLTGRKPYCRLITGCRKTETSKNPDAKKVLIMDIVQFGLAFIEFLILIASMLTYREDNLDNLICNIAATVCAVAFLAFTVLYPIKNRKSIKSLILPVIRNLFLSCFFGILIQAFTVTWSFGSNYSSKPERSIWWDQEYIWYAVVYVMLVLAVYYAVLTVINKVKKAKNNL